VPQDNFYRCLEAKVDLSFARDLVESRYSLIGRPSIDPVVFFKLQLIMFFEGIRSERQLMETVNMRLDHRWYIGYDLDEAVPDHSSLTKIRERYGLEVFLGFFERIVELCIEAGLVWGKELYFDGTKVRANAAMDGIVPRFYYKAQQHLKQLFEEGKNADETASDQAEGPNECLIIGGSAAQEEHATTTSSPRSFVEKYNGARLTGVRKPSYDRYTDYWVSPTDPDATPMKPSGGGRTVLGYHTHYVVDGGKARIILAVLVTPSSIMDNTPMLDLARWARFRWRLHPKIAVGDAKYGTIPNIVGLEQDGICAYLPTADLSQRTRFYPPERFNYVPERNVYMCPQGQELRLLARRKSTQTFVYRADAEVCNACLVKSECTKSKNGRTLSRSFFQEYLDRLEDYQKTWYYKKAMRKRLAWVEPLFGEAKQWHQMRWFLLRSIEKVNIEGLMKAAGQNIKRLLKAKRWPKRLDPAGAVALPLPFFSFCLVSRLQLMVRGLV
jgi:transposase